MNDIAGLPDIRIRGEALASLPQDLFIPPEALQVFLESFQGPLDLLLYLIRKQNLEILEVNVSLVTEQYMAYVNAMDASKFELAAEYLVMAATLAEIKSRVLLPREERDEEDEGEDPRAVLVRRLREYEKFRQAAEDLDAMPRMDRDLHQAVMNRDNIPERVRPAEVSMGDLLSAFQAVLKRAELFESHHISPEVLSTRERMAQVVSRLEGGCFFSFVNLFRPEEGRKGVVVTFVAILELVKEGLIELTQNTPMAPVYVRLKPNESE
jgi:segregation and condensation protein A